MNATRGPTFRSKQLGVAVAAAVLLVCAPRRPPPDLSLDPAKLLDQVKEGRARVKSVQGNATVRVEAGGKKGSVPAFVAAARPDRVRIETLDFFGNPVAVLVASHDQLSLYDAREKVFYKGAATRENVKRLVPVGLTPAELVDVLCASAPLLEGSAERAAPGRGFVTLVIVEGELTQTLRIGPRAQVQSSEIRGPGGRAPGTYDVAFEKFRERSPGCFPDEAKLSATEGSVRLKWKDVEPNAAVDAKLFQLDPPSGARVVELGAEAPPPMVPEESK